MMMSSRDTTATYVDASASWSLWVIIPRTEEVYENQVLGKGGARTVFVLQVSCKGAGAGGSAGGTQTWQLKKRYGYFERVAKVAEKCAAAAGVKAPQLPQRKLIGHRDPKYLQALREQLQLYLEHVIELVQRTTAGSLDLAGVLQRLELPTASDSATWEQRSRFGVAHDGKSLPIELEGFLRKQGGSKSDVKRGWKERWFVLTGSSLHYYSHPEVSSARRGRQALWPRRRPERGGARVPSAACAQLLRCARLLLTPCRSPSLALSARRRPRPRE